MKHKPTKIWTGVRPGTPLTSRETEILKLLCSGHGTKQIAPMVGLSDSTVETHRAKMMVRTGSYSCVQLGVWAAKQGIA